jgi:hypothetical protein
MAKRSAGGHPVPFTAIKPFYARDTLVIHEGKGGLIGVIENGAAEFKPFDDQMDLSFFRAYIPLRDSYMELYAAEAQTLQVQPDLRVLMNRYYESFKAKNGELNRQQNRNRLLQDPAFGFTILSSLERRENEAWAKSGIKMKGASLLEHALENTSPYFSYTIGSGENIVRLPDNDAIQLGHQKIEAIRSRFEEWLRDLPNEDKKTIEELYNNTFNCYVLRQYDGSHLKFPGLDLKALGIPALYNSQFDAAWRVMQQRGGLIDHEVGLGKTLTMIIAAIEMKRLGIVQKPMILALKANVGQIVDTFRKAYPQAKILAPGENDFTPVKRQALFHQIKNNNWDCIILTHDQFGKIPQSPEIQQQIFEIELDNIDRDLDTLRSLGGEISRSIRATNMMMIM